MPAVSTSRAGELLIRVDVNETGKHGAVRIKRASLVRRDGTIANKTPGDVILREQAVAAQTPVTGVVGANPTFSSGGGTGGKDVYTVVLGSGEGAGFGPGDFIRSQAANLGGVYQIDSINADTLKVLAASGEMDIANGATVEKVVPEGCYGAAIEVSAGELAGQNGTLEVVIQGQSSERGNKPALIASFEERKLEAYWPENEANSIKVY